MTKDYCMRTAEQELTLRSALSDPLIRSLMAADNVDPVELESTLKRIAEQVTLSPMSTMRSRCVC
jgi:hypothetical protein